jgi:alpha-tubulin suppressor-like RCC1 family protein
MMASYFTPLMKRRNLPILSLLLLLINTVVVADVVTSPKTKSSRSNYPRNAHHVAGGGGFAVEIRNGEIWAWGNNTNGQLGIGNNLQQEVPVREATTASNWSDINPGKSHVLALKADGTLWAWGRNLEGQLGNGTTTSSNVPIQVGTDQDWVSMGCSGNQSFAIKANGTLWAWGDNTFGQLGVSVLAQTPTQVGTANNWISVAAGSDFTMALRSDGSLWTWGADGSGQLGNGTAGAVSVPTQISQGNQWSTIEAGLNYAMAIQSNGSLWTWGNNSRGQLGIGSFTDADQPTQVSSTMPWIGISCGQDGLSNNNQHSLGLKADGIAYSWGDNVGGQLGNGQFGTTAQNFPLALTALSNIVAVECGWGVSYIRNVSGRVFAFGFDIVGAVGNPAVNQNINQPLAISIVPIGWSSFSSGENFTLAIKSNGTLWFWGSNSNGQLGVPFTNTPFTSTATQIGTDTTWKSVSAGRNHLLAIKGNGQLYAWGSNSSGQIGNGSSIGDVVTPFQVPSTLPWITASAGSSFSLGIKANGSLWTWGENGAGQLGFGNNSQNSSNFSPQQVGSSNDWIYSQCAELSAAAVRSNGTLWMWGDNTFGQLGNGNNTNTVSNFSPSQVPGANWTCVGHTSGAKHVVGLKANGTIWSWGRNNFGQLGRGNNTNNTSNYAPAQIGNDQNWVLTAVGAEHSGALKANGTLWTWGDNTYGQLGQSYFGNTPPIYIPTQVNNFNSSNNPSPGDPEAIIDFNCGYTHSGIIRATRERICMTGRNTFGQIGDGTFGAPNNRNEFQCLVYAPPCVDPEIPQLQKFPTNVCPGQITTLSIVSGNLNSATVWKWYAGACGSNYIASGNSIQVNPNSTTTYFVRGEGGGCVTPGSCAGIVVTVTPNLVPSIVIATSNTTVCVGAAVSFTSTISNGGTNPTYQWTVNGNPVGTNSSTFTTAALLTGDLVACHLSSNQLCAFPDTAGSNQLEITVSASPTAIISAGGSTTICSGQSVALNANTGLGLTYQWLLNGVPINGATQNSILAYSSGTYSVVVSNASSCSTVSNSITVSSQICGGPSTQIRSADCGRTNFNLQSSIVADLVSSATQYEFQFNNAGDYALVASKIQTSRTLAISSVSPALQWGTNYVVRVRPIVGATPGAFGNPCVIGFVQDPSIYGIPTTNLISSNCGKLNYLLASSITAVVVSGATHYEFEFKNAANTTVVATKLQSNYFTTLSSVSPALQWGTQYNVRVRAYYGTIAGTYGASCLIGLIPDPAISGVPNTSLSNASCNKTNLSLTGNITCIAVTGANQYEWEFKNPSTGVLVALKTTTTSTCVLSSVSPALQWGTQYNVKVRAFIAGTGGVFSTVCLIGLIPDPATAGVPSTRLNSMSCGNQNLTLQSSIVALTVSGANQYEFEFSNPSTSVVYATKLNTSATCFLNSVSPAIQWGTQYNVRVRAFIAGIGGTFANVCSIGIVPDPSIFGVPNTQLRSVDCGKLTFLISNNIAANPVAGASQFEFEFSDPSTNNVVATKLQTSATLNLGSVSPALQAGNTYNVRVRAYINSFVGNYSTVCLIGIVSGAREIESGGEELGNSLNEQSFSVVLYPNPTDDYSSLEVRTNQSENLALIIYDMAGRKVYEEFIVSNKTEMVGGDLQSGVYMICIMDKHGNKEMLRMLKK